jgi:hypothetical protein
MARAPTISVKELSQRGQIRLSFSVRNHSFWHAWQNTTSLPAAAPRWLPPEDAMVGGGRGGWLLRKAARAPSRPVATAIARRARDATVPICGGKHDRVGSRGVQRRSGLLGECLQEQRSEARWISRCWWKEPGIYVSPTLAGDLASRRLMRRREQAVIRCNRLLYATLTGCSCLGCREGARYYWDAWCCREW